MVNGHHQPSHVDKQIHHGQRTHGVLTITPTHGTITPILHTIAPSLGTTTLTLGTINDGQRLITNRQRPITHGRPTRASQRDSPEESDEDAPVAGLADEVVEGRVAPVVPGVHVDSCETQLVDGRHGTGVVELDGVLDDHHVQEGARVRIADRHVTSALGQLSHLRRDRLHDRTKRLNGEASWFTRMKSAKLRGLCLTNVRNNLAYVICKLL